MNAEQEQKQPQTLTGEIEKILEDERRALRKQLDKVDALRELHIELREHKRKHGAEPTFESIFDTDDELAVARLHGLMDRAFGEMETNDE